MKIILTGASGFIGTEVLRQCIQNASVTSVIVLSRREISIKDPKLEVVIMADFLTYPDDVRKALADADACIWCLGVAGSAAGRMDSAEARKVGVDYTMTGVRAILDARRPSNPDGRGAPSNATPSRPFRFLYLSGKAIVSDPDAKLWIMEEARKLRGELEHLLPALERERPGELESSVSKPGMVLNPVSRPWQAAIFESLAPVGFRVRVDALARALIKQVLEGFSEGPVVQNDRLVKLGTLAK